MGRGPSTLALTLLALAAMSEARVAPSSSHVPSKLLELRGGNALRPLLAFAMPANATANGGAATVSGVLGYCSGKAARAVTSGVSVGVGIAFVALTILSKAGYVTINYTKLERDILSIADFNKDGKLDAVDYQFATQKFVHLLTDHGLSSATGFAAGFAAGYKQN
mmetsp:Transcript_30397/g.81745  ORF Transcript_30397/g.81745 Transcript_30397/m.81745 type:complete len:165 (+) Transcript_30397:35-529(+)